MGSYGAGFDWGMCLAYAFTNNGHSSSEIRIKSKAADGLGQ